MNKTRTIIISISLLSGLLASCSLDKATDLFEDKGCIYKGVLAIQRESLSDWSLVSYHLEQEQEKDPEEVSPLKPESWKADEKEMEVLIGKHFGLYYPNYLELSPEKGILNMKDELVSQRPLMFAGDSTFVRYDKRSVLELAYKDRSVAVSLVLTNSSQRELSELKMSNNNGYRGYDALAGKPTNKGVFLFEKAAISIPSMGYKEYTGYLFGLQLPASVNLQFKDDSGLEYLIEVVDAYRPNIKNPKLYEAVIDLDEDALIAKGAKRTITSIEIDGKDIIFPAGGGTMVVDIKVVKRSRTYVKGQLLSTEETPITDYTYTTDGTDELQVEKIGDSKFRISGPANLGEKTRTKELHITTSGVTRMLTISQPAQGFEISGEIE